VPLQGCRPDLKCFCVSTLVIPLTCGHLIPKYPTGDAVWIAGVGCYQGPKPYSLVDEEDV
jgi:hypothetical protein